jgi:tRNA modification GTPase
VEVALASTLTTRTANILLDQYHGALESALLEILGLMDTGEVALTAAKLGELVARVPLGRHLTKPWRVVLAGAPNVGKSTLMNALVGYQRSITSPLPGTTRDALSVVTAFDGWPVELVDTAGIHDSAVGLDAAGIEMGLKALHSADLVLWLLDSTKPPQFPIEPPRRPVLWVRSKVDLSAAWSPADLCLEPNPMLSVSARTGEGIAALSGALAGLLVPDPPAVGVAVPFEPGGCAALERAGALWERGDHQAARALLVSLLQAPSHDTACDPYTAAVN